MLGKQPLADAKGYGDGDPDRVERCEVKGAGDAGDYFGTGHAKCGVCFGGAIDEGLLGEG